MAKTVLLTSFATWKPQQISNSADDLLLEIGRTRTLPPSIHLFRQLPVNVPVAQELAIAKMQQLQPQTILCCGMAESRTKLSLELRAVVGTHKLYTSINVKDLAAGLTATEISEDAGRFVCNGLYYAILNYLQNRSLDAACMFVHVPLLSSCNRGQIIADFYQILERVLTT